MSCHRNDWGNFFKNPMMGILKYVNAHTQLKKDEDEGRQWMRYHMNK